MNYFLIANNDQITDKTIENLPIKEKDIIILYNRQMPLKWNKIKEHKNKWLFLRKMRIGFHGENLINKNKSLFNNIYLTGCLPIEYEILDDFKKKYKIENVYRYVDNESDIKNFISFDKGKYPQTGLISYIFIKSKYNYENIYLIGFTNDYKTGLWSGHSKKTEQEYFKKELLENKKLIKINY